MRIRTEKDVKKLDEKLKTELGIDVTQYRNEEAVDNFAELLAFPAYIVSWVIRPIGFFLLLFIFGFYALNLVHIEYVIYGVIGFVLFLITGISFGLLSLFFKLKKDIWNIANYSLNILKSVIEDLSNVNSQITDANRKDVLSLVFKGIIHIVTIPMLAKIVTSKIPILGSLISKLIKKILVLLSDKLEFDDEKIEELVVKDSENNEGFNSYIKSVDNASKGLETLVTFTFKVAKIPFLIIFIVSISILCLFIYLIN